MTFNASQLIAIEWTLIFLTLLLVLLRLYIRIFCKNLADKADIFLIIAWLSFLSQGILDTKLLQFKFFDPDVIQDENAGSMANSYDSSDDDGTDAVTVVILKILYTEFETYYVAMYCVKFSMLIFYYSLISKSFPKMRLALNITTIITIIAFLINFSIGLFYCHPIKRNWALDETYCSSASDIIPNSIKWSLHVGTDLMIWILPLPILKYLSLTPSKKLGVTITFSLGFLCILFANLTTIASLIGLPSPWVWLFATLEQTWAIMVVCCPSFKGFLNSGFNLHPTSFLNKKRLKEQEKERNKSKNSTRSELSDECDPSSPISKKFRRSSIIIKSWISNPSSRSIKELSIIERGKIDEENIIGIETSSMRDDQLSSIEKSVVDDINHGNEK